MNTILQTAEFQKWLKGIKDPQDKAAIVRRLENAAAGNFSDSKSVGGGVSEMRINTGPGYRVYYTKIGSIVYLVIGGGDKSTQKADIKHAQAVVESLKE
jgi:putative addiction module killer protein